MPLRPSRAAAATLSAERLHPAQQIRQQHAPQTYPKKPTSAPRKYVAECNRLGGRIVSRFCYTEGAGGPTLVHIPESFDRD
jgi:hypothetical protein